MPLFFCTNKGMKITAFIGVIACQVVLAEKLVL